jgi:cytoskeleton protein RodZ
MGQDHQQPLSAETDDWVFSSGISPGALLKREREKKGLTHAQISQQTRLRPHILEAIENEEWDLLPAPTLVMGFIRSYARVLGVDEDRILELYREEAGVDDFSQKFVLPSMARKKKWPFLVVGLLLLLGAAAAFYVWSTFKMDLRGTSGTGMVTVQDSSEKEAPAEAGERERSEAEASIETEPLSPGDAALQAAPEITVVPETPESTVSEPAEQGIAIEEKPQGEVLSTTVKPEAEKLRLKGHVTERTWVSISIDGQKAKEYVFTPSDTPEWKAEKSFELLIGNAGGIALEFNGEKMDNLGKPGQVVRIKLPKDEERSPTRN